MGATAVGNRARCYTRSTLQTMLLMTRRTGRTKYSETFFGRHMETVWRESCPITISRCQHLLISIQSSPYDHISKTTMMRQNYILERDWLKELTRMTASLLNCVCPPITWHHTTVCGRCCLLKLGSFKTFKTNLVYSRNFYIEGISIVFQEPKENWSLPDVCNNNDNNTGPEL
eukprot:scaffold5564_cov66-Cylindrotheca_fusiformis.AAC.3